ncbi:hypothetical protein M3Y98_00633500 [Aphelenchoides besseyi]|nr:hypothetical protein M3Y98_00633500 [Aphelenchoides besseyi]
MNRLRLLIATSNRKHGMVTQIKCVGKRWKAMIDKIIYVGSYTEVPYCEKQTEFGIHVVRLQVVGNEKPRLEVLSKRPEKNVTFFLNDRQRGKLYGVSEGSPPLSSLHRFDVASDETGELSNHVEVDFQESGACFIGGLRAPHGALLAISFYDSGAVRIVEDDSECLLPHDPIVFKKHSGVIKDRQEAPHCHAAYPLNTGDEFLVPDLGADSLYKVKVHGQKARVVHEIALPQGSGPRHVLKHPEYNLLFVISELANTLTVYSTDGMLQQLTQTDEHSTLGDAEQSYKEPSDPLQTAAHIQLSADGQFVLVSNRGRNNSISIFQIVDFDEGKLKLVRTLSSHGHFPRFFTLIDDKYLLIANQLSHSLVLFEFDHGNVHGPIASLDIPSPAALSVL